ncbi:AAA family ATPase [Ramlibacter sp. H39-3-26]|nr:AAA family ATPase [Ramlibacter sp. H39-3-26]MDF1485368.1 AAA family ATPase [Ramlibacter sp. H39-3-26]
MARAAGLSAAAACRLVHGQWPARRAGEVRQRVVDYLKEHGASMAHLRGLVLAQFPRARTKKLAPPGCEPGEAVPESPETTATHETLEEESMLLKNETLTPLARKHFKLSRSPFVDDINSRNDIFASQHGRYVRAAMLDAACNHGFIAIIGQSGSGKSTLREDLEERIREERRPIVIIKPYVQGMEASEVRGRPLRSGHIAESIVDALAPGVSLKSSPQARYKQVHELLKASRSAGYTHLLVIEEAHRLPVPTLKHLKNFMELKDGLRRLLGVCLIGQNELYDVLSERNPEVREIVQRCEQITMEPLDNDVESYLQLKFERLGVKLADVFEPDAMDAIRARLIHTAHGNRTSEVVSICYPQVVNNLVCRALNAAAAVGYEKIDAQVIAGC